MNKQITLIAGIVVLIGLGALAAFNKIDLESFGTFGIAILGAIYGFYKKVENDELKDEIKVLDFEAEHYETISRDMITENQKLKTLNSSLVNTVKQLTPQPEPELDTVVEEVVKKSTKRRKK